MSVFIGEKNKRVELAERKDATNPNLLTGSKDFTGDWIDLDQVTQKDKYLDFTAVYDDWQWNGIAQYIDAKKDEVLTASAYVKAKAGSSINWFTPLTSDNEDGHTKADTSPNGQSITVTGDWQRTSFTFTVTSDGAIKPRIESDGTEPFWIAGMKLEHGSVATPWCPAYDDYASNSNFNTLQNNVYTKPEVDSKTSGTVVTAYDVASKKPTTETASYTSEELVDQGVLPEFADQINQLKGRQTVDAPDFNTLTDTGIYMISNPDKGKNFPSEAAGTLAVFNGNGIRITQLYVGDDGVSAYMRIYGWINGSTAWGNWNQIAWTSDITNLQNTVNQQSQTIQSLTTRLTNVENEISYIKANYIEGKQFPASQEAQAVAWENANPQGIAFITSN